MDTAKYLEMISTLSAGRHIIQTPDQRGDGFDIACAAHDTSLLPTIKSLVAQRGGTVSTLYASGFACAWIVTIPEPDSEQLRLCQHPGAWGPWYHVSRYVKTATGKWRFAEELYNVGNYDKAKATGLEFGRP
jgi:hypothetical protein